MELSKMDCLFVVSFILLLKALCGESSWMERTDKRCRRRNTVCQNVFVWHSDRRDFVSLLNVSVSGFQIADLKGLEGKRVRVIADNMPPYVTSSNRSQYLGGFLGDIWAIIEDAFHFKTNVSSINYDTGLNMIEEGLADVMLAAAVVKDGLDNVYYSQPYFYNWYHLYIKRPEAKASSSSYTKTFTVKLWIYTLALFILLTLILWITTKFMSIKYRSEENLSIPTCFLGVISGFINQGYDLKIRSYSGRIQVMFALMLGVILYSAMNAVLVAQLSVFDIPFPFDSLDDIADRRTHSLCLRSNSFVYNNFTKNGIILPRWKNVLNAGGCLDINNQSNLAQILCKDGVIVLENRVVMGTVIKTHNITCKIVNFNPQYFRRENYFLMLKSFGPKKQIDKLVKRMRSTGVLQRLEDKWVQRDKLDEGNNVKSPQVTMDHISGIIFMYVFLTGVSVLILATEILHHKYSSRKFEQKLAYIK